MLDNISRQFAALLHLSVRPDDLEETRERKALSIGLALGMALGGVIWGIYCLIGGEPRAAVVPFAYTIFTFFNILYLRASSNDQRFRSIQIFLSLMLPFLLMVALGGFQSSGAVVIWSLVAPLGATLFTKRGEAIFWFIAFILLVILSGLIEPIIAHPNNFTFLLLTLFYVMNILAPTSLALVLLFYFLQQREQAVQLLKEAQTRAEAANQAKSTFLANMSHELRSPMNAILGFTQVMLRAPDLNRSQKENLEVILRSGEHLLSLINQVLDLSKVEAGRMELVEQDFDLLTMLDELNEMFSLQAANKGLNLTIDHGEQVPHYVRLDELKLRQVLINLLNNALKFTQAGGVSLQVDCNNSGGDMLQLSFAVEDSGSGIAPEELDAVFAAFTQTESGSKAGGAGLGLPISRQLVRLMGGDIQVSSTLGQGTKFQFSLPAHVAAGSHITHNEEHGSVVGLVPGQPVYRVLIVDDEWENREALYRLLSPIGFSLRQAENGEEAIAVAKEWRPNLIWMDIRMPVMNGYEACQAIKEAQLEPEPVIVALTASTFTAEKTQAMDAGCAAILHKPYREEEIFTALTRYLDVRFLYKAEEADDVPQSATVTAADLATLPPALRAKLSEALIQLDTGLMDEVVAEIKNKDEKTAASINAMLRQYEYEPLLAALEDVKD